MVVDLIHGEAAFGGDFFERDAALGIAPEVFTRCGDGAAVFLVLQGRGEYDYVPLT